MRLRTLPIAMAALVIIAISPPSLYAAVSLSALAGFNGGPGGSFGVMFSEFAEHMPLNLRFAVGYSGCDPGDPLAARRVFINDNTDGTPTKNGRRWDYRADAVWHTKWRGLETLSLLGGPRFSRFSGQFDFIGGNEFFNVVSNEWGLGVGAEAGVHMNSRDLLLVAMGVDYFFSARLTGHDTSYSPDGTSVNPAADYTWADADAAIHQPRWTPRVMLGVQRRLGPQ